MSDNTANRGHFNIPPPKPPPPHPLPPNKQPYGSNQPYGGQVQPNQFFNNSLMNSQTPSNQMRFFPPPFNTRPPPPPSSSSSFSAHPSYFSASPYLHRPPPPAPSSLSTPQYPPPPPPPHPHLLSFSSPFPPPIASHQVPTEKEEENADKLWITNWLKRIGKEEKTKMPVEKADVSGSIKISETKVKVLKMRKLVQELESRSKSLTVMMKTLDDEQWSIRVLEIEEKKSALVRILNEFASNKELLTGVKRQLMKRSRKRNREKRRRAERRMVERERRMAAEKESKRIDVWLKEKEEEVERARREEEMKREADSVLSGVTRRKNEAKRQLALLEGLRKLHKARVVAWNAMGLVISNTQIETFNTVVDRLTGMWNVCLDNYNLEEHGLKVMLNESNAEDKASAANRHKQIVRQWEAALFGSAANATDSRQDRESFVAVRKDWDRFVVREEVSVMSSSIPIGWVIPTGPNNEEWRKLLKHQMQS